MNKYAHDIRTFPRDAAAAMRHRGLRGAWRELRLRTIDRVLHVGRCIVVQQDLTRIPSRPLPSGICIEVVAGDDWSRFAEIASPPTIARFRRAAARGRTCLAAWRGEHPVGYTWISPCMEPDLERYPLPLPEGATYHWDLFVTSAERSRGLGSALVTARLQWARDHGSRLAWRMVELENGAAHRTLERSSGPDTHMVGTLVFLTVGRRTWSRYRPVSLASSERSATDTHAE